MAMFGTGKLPKTGNPGQGSGAPSRVSASRQGSNSETKSSLKTSKVQLSMRALAAKRKLANNTDAMPPQGGGTNMDSAKGNPAQKTVGAWPAGQKFPGFNG